MKTNEEYWKSRSEKYNKLKWIDKNELLECMTVFAGDVTGKRVLDLGTGTGKVLTYFKSKFPNAEYYGVDISQDMLNYIDKDLEFKLDVCAMEDLSIFEDNYFDVVTARMCIHHSDDIDKAFREVKRILKDGGLFIVCEGTPPNRQCVDFYENMFKYKEERHTFLLDDLTNWYVNEGFNEIHSKTVVSKDMSLNNWVENSGIPEENKTIIKKLHYEAPDYVKKAYAMKEENDDLIMNWKFVVVCGQK